MPDAFVPDQGQRNAALELAKEFASACGLDNDVTAKKPAKKRKKGEGEEKKKKKKKKVADDGPIDFKALADAGKLKSLKVPQLKAYLGENGLDKKGRKTQLIERIREHMGLD